MKKRIKFFGSGDTEMKKAIVFRENFMTALKELANYENYDILKKNLDKIKNPLQFFKFTQKSQVLQDLFLWYERKRADVSIWWIF